MTTKKSREMTYEERVRFYQDHKDDEALWSDKAVEQTLPSGGVETTFSLPLSGEEIDYLYDIAKAEGVTLGQFIRQAALEAAKGRAKRSKASLPRKD
jgi:hypothetical protein